VQTRRAKALAGFRPASPLHKTKRHPAKRWVSRLGYWSPYETAHTCTIPAQDARSGLSFTKTEPEARSPAQPEARLRAEGERKTDAQALTQSNTYTNTSTLEQITYSCFNWFCRRENWDGKRDASTTLIVEGNALRGVSRT